MPWWPNDSRGTGWEHATTTTEREAGPKIAESDRVLSGCVRGTTGTVAGDCALTITERGPPTARRAPGAHDGYGVPDSGHGPTPGTDRRQCPGAASAGAVTESRSIGPKAPAGGGGGGGGGGRRSQQADPNVATPSRRGRTPKDCAYDRRLDKPTLIEGGSRRAAQEFPEAPKPRQRGKSLGETRRDGATTHHAKLPSRPRLWRRPPSNRARASRAPDRHLRVRAPAACARFHFDQIPRLVRRASDGRSNSTGDSYPRLRAARIRTALGGIIGLP